MLEVHVAVRVWRFKSSRPAPALDPRCDGKGMLLPAWFRTSLPDLLKGKYFAKESGFVDGRLVANFDTLTF